MGPATLGQRADFLGASYAGGPTLTPQRTAVNIEAIAAAFRQTLAEMRAEGDDRFEAVEQDGTKILLRLRPELGQPSYTVTLELAAFAKRRRRRRAAGH